MRGNALVLKTPVENATRTSIEKHLSWSSDIPPAARFPLYRSRPAEYQLLLQLSLLQTRPGCSGSPFSCFCDPLHDLILIGRKAKHFLYNQKPVDCEQALHGKGLLCLAPTEAIAMYDRESLVPSTGLTIGTVREEAKGPGSNIGDGGRQYCNEAKNEPVTDCTGKTHRHASGGGSDGSPSHGGMIMAGMSALSPIGFFGGVRPMCSSSAGRSGPCQPGCWTARRATICDFVSV
jgi:hypothetical protein